MAAKETKKTLERIAEPKGRPFLQWVGKHPLDQVAALPAQRVEVFDPCGRGVGVSPADDGQDAHDTSANLLFHGDNKDVLAWLLCNGYRGKVNLVYIDPPFDSGADYVRKVELRGLKGAAKLEGEAYTLGEQIQYTDIWANDNYLQFMYERLQLLRELLAEEGSIYVHCDWRRVHHFRYLLDETFGAESFINEIIWQHQIMGGSHEKRFPKAHETIVWYAKGNGYRIRTENELVRVPFGDYVQNTMKQDEQGRWYYERRRMSRKATAAEAASKAHTRTYVDDPNAGTVATDVWGDMLSYQELPGERQGLDLYPTQKTVKLLSRLVAAASDPGDLVLDCFIGSGTTAAVAQKLGRRWIGCDINKGAVQTTSKRLQTIISEQLRSGRAESPSLPGLEENGTSAGTETSPYTPVYSFAVYRVNDYDLQIQHNEAVQLACEAAHVQRTRSDAFFDGVQDGRLVKIIPFNHPCTLLDLELITRELHKRKDDHRDVLIVCLGKETAVDGWVEDWNKRQPISSRSGRKPRRINQLEVLELRTSRKYGEFFQHDPASATISVKRIKDKLEVAIESFLSPTIMKRLKNDQGVLSAKITNWRSMVDCALIDTDYDGEVFNICHSDVPAKKSDLVSGEYTLPAPRKGATIAVKIIDMLGEEVLVTA